MLTGASINPWVMGIPCKNEMDNYHKHQLLCVSVPREASKKQPLPYLLDDFDERPILPIFKSHYECQRFKRNVLNRYRVNDAPWVIVEHESYGTENDDFTSLHIRQETLLFKTCDEKKNTMRPIPFDMSNQDIIIDCAMQAYMGYFVVEEVDMCPVDNVLSIQGILVNAVYDELDDNAHVEYMKAALEQAL